MEELWMALNNLGPSGMRLVISSYGIPLQNRRGWSSERHQAEISKSGPNGREAQMFNSLWQAFPAEKKTRAIDLNVVDLFVNSD
jgi:hypothetical protein